MRGIDLVGYEKSEFDETAKLFTILIMNVSVKALTEQALSLPVTEREKLASSILQSTHHQELTTNDEEWIALAEERFMDLQSGKDSGIPESEFFSKVKERVQWK